MTVGQLKASKDKRRKVFMVLCAGNVRFHAKLFIVRRLAIVDKQPVSRVQE